MPDPSKTLNLIHDFALRMFPDDSGQWTVAEMVAETNRQYSSPEDCQFGEHQFRNAIRGLRQRKTEFPNADSIEEIPCAGGTRYPPISARLILRTVIRGRLPKKLTQTES